MSGARIELGGVRVEAPTGCSARIRRRVPAAVGAGDGDGLGAAAEEVARPVVHVSTVDLPAERGDFGSGVVEALRRNDVLVVLVELDPSQAGSALTQREGIPRSIPPAQYSPDAMQRTIHGQSGTQVFFTERGRAFCLYVVLGSHGNRHELARVVDRILAGIEILEGEGS